MSDHLPTLRHDPAHTLAPAIVTNLDLVSAFLAGRKPTTLRAYRQDLEDFARFTGQPGPGPAVELLLTAGHGPANAVALAYRADLLGRELAPATVARRLAALRSMVKLARTLGRVAWTLEVEAPKTEAYRDTRGPGLDGWRAILAVAKDLATTPKGKRDLALVRLLHDLGLRRGEAVALDIADVDLEAGTVAVVGKGKLERVNLSLNRPAIEALAAWLAVHPVPCPDGPVFVGLDTASGHGRLDGGNAWRIVRELGKRAGLSRPVRPHGLRHQGITRALDLAGGDVRRVQRFSRHAKMETLMKYDDNRRDDHGALARMLGEDSE